MSKFEVKPSNFQKVHGKVALETAEPSDLVQMIVKVEEADYVPSGVTLRARVDSTMFTGEASASVIMQLENDPKVASVSVSQPLKLIG